MYRAGDNSGLGPSHEPEVCERRITRGSSGQCRDFRVACTLKNALSMKNRMGWAFVSLGLVACEVSPVEYSIPDGRKADASKADASAQTMSACIPKPKEAPKTDPSAYPACACAKGGAARCVPSAEIPGALASQLEACTGGACVPDSIVKSGGQPPPSCESPFGEGRCVSLCIPAVAEKASLLDRGKGDVCAADERCAPCKNPLANGESTGVCEIGSASAAATCEDVKPTTQNPPASGGACTAPASCKSVADAEGRCVPESLPQVAEMKDLLPVSTCGAGSRCAPCFHPLTGQASGVCSTVACDAPKEPAKTLKQCCRIGSQNRGRCVPKDLVPADGRDVLDSDDGICDEGKDLCVPNELMMPATPPVACTAVIPFVGPLQGICAADCFDTITFQGTCPSGQACVPKQ